MSNTLIPFSLDTSFLTGQVKENSARKYTQNFEAYLTYATENTLNPADSATLAQWRTDLVQKGKSPYTINQKIASVNSIIQKASELGRVDKVTAEGFDRIRGVKVEALKDRVRSVKEITPKEMREITSKPNNTLKGKRDSAILHTFASTGMRISELARLKLCQIGGEVGAYFVRVTGKNQPEPIAIPLSDEAYRAIQEWISLRQLSTEYVFTSFQGRGEGEKTRAVEQPMSEVGIWQVVKQYAGDEHRPHSFRKFVGTQLAEENPLFAQEVLRHKDIKTTMNHYVHKKTRLGLTNNLY